LRYVGKAKNIPVRWRQHKAQLRKGSHKNKGLQADWSRYGESAFEFVELERCPVVLLDLKEAYWIKRSGDYNKQRPIAHLFGWWGLIGFAIALLIVGIAVWVFFSR